MRFLNRLKYWFLYPNHIYKINYPLNNILIECLKHEIKKVETSESCYFNIIFNNGITCKLWDENKYYGWLSYGEIIKDNNIIYQYQQSRPSRKTMYKLRKKLKEYNPLKQLEDTK